MREILKICWQFTSTYTYQFFVDSNVIFSTSTHHFHRQVLNKPIHPENEKAAFWKSHHFFVIVCLSV